jgi:hypothetical protein
VTCGRRHDGSSDSPDRGRKTAPGFYMEPDDERALIRQSLDLLAQVTGEKPKGW